MDQIHDITINYLYYLYHVNFTPPIYIHSFLTTVSGPFR